MSENASTATPETKQPQSISNTIDGILDRTSSKILLAYKDNKELRERACQYMRQLTETDSDKLYMARQVISTALLMAYTEHVLMIRLEQGTALARREQAA